jgi:hypothetical protein
MHRRARRSAQPLWSTRLRLIICLALVFSSGLSHADDWYEVAPYSCDARSDRLVIKHFGAYNEAGLALLEKHAGPENLMRPVGPQDISGQAWRVFRVCKLSSGVFKIQVRPMQDALSATAECGMWGSARIRIELNGKELLSLPFANSCGDPNIVDQISISGSTGKAEIHYQDSNDFYSVALPNKSLERTRKR